MGSVEAKEMGSEKFVCSGAEKKGRLMVVCLVNPLKSINKQLITLRIWTLLVLVGPSQLRILYDSMN